MNLSHQLTAKPRYLHFTLQPYKSVREPMKVDKVSEKHQQSLEIHKYKKTHSEMSKSLGNSAILFLRMRNGVLRLRIKMFQILSAAGQCIET